MVCIPKIYSAEDVLTAAMERINIIFSHFPHLYLCVSGGKDSSVMLQLCASVARRQGRKFSVQYIDLEAQYQATIQHIEGLRRKTADVVDRFYWCCLPLSLRNAVSVIQPKWICWDLNDRNKWVRDMPDYDCVINENNLPEEWTWFYKGMEFEEFTYKFSQWFQKIHGDSVGVGIAIRSNESLNRFNTIVSKRKETFQGYGWTTKLRVPEPDCEIYYFYPLYDWRTEDIWGAVSQLGLAYNEIYELMYKNGVSIHQQRLCQPYGDDQRNGLNQFRALEPETWERVVNRVHGVNFGNIYARTSLLGNIKSEKPSEMTWQQYTVLLLESLGLYSPELRDHYYRKINTYLVWWASHGFPLEKIPDEADRKLEAKKKAPSWRRIARAIEKNDFWLRRLSFGPSKSDVRLLMQLRGQYQDFIHLEDAQDKQMRKIIMEEKDSGKDTML
jgi:predicted phosphoadenosine phosphosulfate sulfurtransferase